MVAEGESGPHVLADPGYFIWGTTVVRTPDGRYHAYYSRWAHEDGFNAWMTDCEIAHAVADAPEGPFVTTGTVIESRHLEGWDRVNAHNPSACLGPDGEVVLYYISNDLRADFEPSARQPFPSDEWLVEHRTTVRNRQCIGVAVAENPEGPFVRHPEPVVTPDNEFFVRIATNPAAIWHEGEYHLVVKGDDPAHEDWFRIQLIGRSEEPWGPFEFEDTPIHAEDQTEDATIWHGDDERFHVLVHVMNQRHFAEFVSDDAVAWQPAEPMNAAPKSVPLEDGEVFHPDRMERPFILTDEEGRPTMSYFAVLQGNRSANLAIPLSRESE